MARAKAKDKSDHLEPRRRLLKAKVLTLEREVARLIGPQASNINGDDYSSLRNRLVVAKANLAEIKLKLQTGELVRTDDIARMVVEAELAFKRRVMGSPRILATRLLGKSNVEEIEDIANQHLKEILDQLSAAYKRITGSLREV